MIPYLDLSAAANAPDVGAAVERVRRSGCFVLGPELSAFEDEFAAYLGVRNCIGVGSGTSAISLVLRALGVGPGDEVIVPAYTAVATWMAVADVGARPVAADSDPVTYAMSPEAAAASRTSDTRAVIAVHLFGRPMDLDPIREALPGIPIIEDAAQAHGAYDGSARAGTTGIAGAFSFYPTKNLGCLGDGGAVVTDDDDLADYVRLARSYGWRHRSESLIVAGNSRLDEIQAAILRSRLTRLDNENVARQAIAARYIGALGALDGITLPQHDAWSESVWHIFPIRVPDPFDVGSRMAEAGVGSLRHYSPLPHQTPAFASDYDSESTLPHATLLAAQSLSLPLNPSLSRGDINRIIDVVASASRAADRRMMP